MDLYVGGYAQGKLDYVKKMFPDCVVYEKNEIIDFINNFTEDNGRLIIFNKFNVAVKEALKNCDDTDKLKTKILLFIEKKQKLIIIADEVGNGIVPIDKDERFYREFTGRLLIETAQKAESVIRIVCGIPQKLK